MEIYYDLFSKNVPRILEQDWNVVFSNSNEREIAIRIFEWKYGPQEVYANMSIESWQDETFVKFNKGYCEGKISFSLDIEKVSVIKIMIAIATFIVSDKSDAKTYVGAVQSLDNIFRSALNVHVIKNGVQRCVFLKMIELAKNNSSIPIKLSEVNSLWNEERVCRHSNLFECLGNIEHEGGCIVKEEQILDSIKELEKINVIRPGSFGEYYIT